MTVPTIGRAQPVLSGLSLSVNSRSLGAQIATALLSDLGVDVTQVQSGSADLADLGVPLTPTGVTVSAYGAAGRYRDAPATDQAVKAIGGALTAQWSYRPGPVYLLTPYASASQGILSATAVLARRLLANADSCEVPEDVSALHSLFALQSGGYGQVAGQEPDRTRWRHTPRGQQPTYATYLTADDQWLFIGASTRPFMIRVLETLGLGDAVPPPPAPGTRVQPFQDEAVGTGIWKRIADVFASQPRAFWLERFGEVGVPIGPVLTVEEALGHEHVRTVGLVDESLTLRNLVHIEKLSDAPPAPQPRGPLPLSGLRVLEVTGYIAGSYVGRLLADLGADVVKVEAPGGDPFRGGTGPTSLGFVSWNYGKRGLAPDLSTDGGRARVLALAQRADIFVTNYRADSLQRLGLSRETLFAANPKLIHCVISAFGEGGPLSRLQGFDPIVQAFAGVQRRQGADGEPIKSQMAATDYMSAMLAVLGVVAARTRQVEDGGGYSVSSSLLAGALLLVYDAAASLRAGTPYSTGGLDYVGPDALEGLHELSDGWILATARDRAANPHGEARTYLDGIAKSDTVDAAIRRLESLGVAALPCLHPDDLQSEPHFADNALWTQLEQPGVGTVTLPAPVFRTTALTGGAPELGVEPSLADWGV